jgi:GT2 family glycosyltransferase
VEIVIVDNASDDGSVESVEGFRNRLHFVRNSSNRGFAAGVNQGVRVAEGAYILILNPDLRVTPGAAAVLEEFMNTHPRAGAIGGYVNDRYLPKRFPTVGTLIMENLGIASPRRSPSLRGRRDRGAPGEGYAVDQPAAAAMMLRREAYEEVGGFDERFYPAWYEDVDFCRRLNAAGWEIYFVPKAQFQHEGGYSAAALGAGDFVRAYYSNQARYARKHLGSAAAGAVRASIAAGMLGRMVTRPAHARAYAKTFWAAVRGNE